MQDLDPSDICKKKCLNPLKRIRVIIRTLTHGRTDGRTDRQTDGRTGWIQYTPPQLRCGGYKKTPKNRIFWISWSIPWLMMSCLLLSSAVILTVHKKQVLVLHEIWFLLPLQIECWEMMKMQMFPKINSAAQSFIVHVLCICQAWSWMLRTDADNGWWIVDQTHRISCRC